MEITAGARLRGATGAWWEHPALVVALALAAALPLLGPPLPPLTDLPGHVAQYHVEHALAGSPELRRFYEFRWQFMGNLGVDLLVRGLTGTLGVEGATRLVVSCIPPLTVLGFLLTARALHGRAPPTAFFALPLTYAFPFQFGFLNFSLSVALCFLLFALWLRLSVDGRARTRAALFAPLSSLLWLCHAYGWGLLGVLAFSADVAARRARGESWCAAALGGALACLPLCLPFLFMLLWRSGDVEQDTGDFFLFGDKLVWLASILRERWRAWDMASAGLLLGLALVGWRGRDLRLAPAMRVAVPLLALLYLLMPRVLISSGFADMRLAPVMIAAAILGVAPEPSWSARARNSVAGAALLFFTARLLTTSVAFAELSRAWDVQLAAVPHVARGSRVLTLTEVPCADAWATNRANHLNSMAVVRRDVFTNGQWDVAGAQMLKLRYAGATPFRADPSHIMTARGCPGEDVDSVAQAVAALPGAFDYLWLIDVPASRWPRDAGLPVVWRGERGVLYRAPATERR